MPTRPAADAAAPEGLGARTRGFLATVLLAGSVLAAWQTHRFIAAQQLSRFEYEIRRIEAAVQQRMSAYVQVLRGGLGLFRVAPPTREQWMLYVDQLQLAERYPGFKSLSFAVAVAPEDLPALVARVRAEPLPPQLTDPAWLREFTLRSPVETTVVPPPVHSPIIYVAPLIPENERVLGVDMMREPQRRAAMERAAQTGQAVLSPLLHLAGQGDGKVGFIAYLAVLDGPRVVGWLTAAFRAEDFMRGLLGEDPIALDVEIYDGEHTQPEALLYSTAGIDAAGTPRALAVHAPAPLTQERPLELPGRSWTMRYSARPGFVSLTDRLAPWLVLAGGLLATALFGVTARSAARLRDALDRVADRNRLLQLEVAERERAEAQVRHRATHDPLTDLANRSLLIERLQRALSRRDDDAGPALVYIDVDGFKTVNDTHGHHVGDELLRAIAGRLRARVRSQDTPARLGGDEFAVLLEGADLPEAICGRLCAEVVDVLREPFTLTGAFGDVTVQVGASIGAALYPRHGRDADALMVAADAAMYAAKRAGKNRWAMAATTGG